MNIRILITAALITSLLLTVGCTSKGSGNVYSSRSVGRVGGVEKGTIVGIRTITVDGTVRYGKVIGAIAGSKAGSTVGRGHDAHELGSAAGLIIGGIAGGEIERAVTSYTAYEYIIETSSGYTLTVVQGAEPKLSYGDKVLVLKGSEAKVIPDTDR
jgi:outer membrane lipoprotein SlyB